LAIPKVAVPSIMMKKIHLGKATDLYDFGTATFGIAKGNFQSVLTLVIFQFFRPPRYS
jgi:hypothetical protein